MYIVADMRGIREGQAMTMSGWLWSPTRFRPVDQKKEGRRSFKSRKDTWNGVVDRADKAWNEDPLLQWRINCIWAHRKS